nr:proteinase inhibitor PSI-1.2-like [Ipomoea batatas]
MATVCKVGFFTILVCGIFLLGSNVELANAQTFCTEVCEPGVAYMICPTNIKTEPDCTNCCKIQNTGCQLYRSNDSPICT